MRTGTQEDIEEAGEWMRARLRRQQPENQLPVTVPLDLVVIELSDLVAFVSNLAVYRNGLEFTLELRARPSTVGEDFLSAALYGHGGHEKRLLLGVEFSDGRRATTLNRRHGHGDDDPAQPTLTLHGGGGSRASASGSIFLSPLPPPGELTLVVAWPDRGVPETTFALPTDEVLAAATSVRELWPWEPEQPIGPPRAPRPPVAEGGWFAAALEDGDDPRG